MRFVHVQPSERVSCAAIERARRRAHLTAEEVREMAEQRMMVDCRDSPSVSGCTLTIAGREDEVLRAAMDHAATVHGHARDAQLENDVRSSMRPEGSPPPRRAPAGEAEARH